MKKESQKSVAQEGRLFQINPNYLSREIAGEYVLIPVGEQTEYTADMGVPNETFHFLWEQFQTPCTLHDAVKAARQQYSDDSGEIERDIQNFIKDCLNAGLLREVK